MANWTPGGFIGQMFKAISKHIAPSGMPAPVLWGDEVTVRDLLREGIADLKFALRVYHFDYPFPPDAVVEFYRTNYGPMSRAFASLDANGQEKLRSELILLWSAHNNAVDDTTEVDAEYIEIIAIRGENLLDAPETTAIHKIGGYMSRRAESLADRIEEGGGLGCLC